jgi:hypothetical protein
MIVGILPGPAVLGAACLEGTTEDGERMIIVTSENPERVTGFDHSVAQLTLERLHLERWRFDYILCTISVPFDGVSRGADPPDFVVEVDGRAVGLDCAVLARERRRTAYALLRRLQGRLAPGAEGRDFSGDRRDARQPLVRGAHG